MISSWSPKEHQFRMLYDTDRTLPPWLAGSLQLVAIMYFISPAKLTSMVSSFSIRSMRSFTAAYRCRGVPIVVLTIIAQRSSRSTSWGRP